MEQKSYTLKECRAFNLEQHDYILQFIRGNYNPKAELKSIVIPDDPHPWKILRSVIKQFYDRECEMARTINFAHCEMERAQGIIKHNEGMQNTYWQMQKEIGDLRRENEQLKESLSQREKSPQRQPEALQELLQSDITSDWVERLDEIQDNLITALGYDMDGQSIGSCLYTARTLQKLFVKLDKEIN